MAFADIRPQVKAVLESIEGIGVVTDYEPWFKRVEDLKAFFQPTDEDVLRGWTISRENVVEAWTSIDRNEAEARHAIIVRGYLALNEFGASEKTFQDLIDTVTARLRREVLDENKFLQTVDYMEAPVVRTIEPRLFSETLVHFCEIVIACRERVAVAA